MLGRRAFPRALAALLAVLLAVASSAVAGASPSDLAHAIDGDAISGDLDFEFELDLDLDAAASSRGAAKSRSRAFGGEEDSGAGDTQQQQLTQVELVDALHGGDIAFPDAPSLDKIAPRSFNFGRGVGYVATKDIKSQELLFALPRSQIMSLESAKRGRVGALLAANPELPPTIVLALHLLEERFLGAASNFSSLIDSLPATGDAINSTMFYLTSELELLQGSQLLRAVAARATALEQFYDALLGPVTSLAMDPPLFAQDEFTTANFRWAMGVVWSHAFPAGNAESDVVLAPVLSTIGVCVEASGKAKCPQSRIEVVESAQQVAVYAAKDYAPGEEVFMFMGYKSSMMLMANHGFTGPVTASVGATTTDQVDLAIVLDANDTLADVKAFLLSKQNMTMNDTHVLSYGSEQLPEKLVTSLRIKLLTGVEIGRFQDLLGPAKDAKDPYTEPRHIVSLRNEFVSTRALLLACKNLLSQYPTSLEQDEKALDALHSQRASRAAQILQMLVIEKRILRHAMELATQQWADLVFSDHPNLLRVD